MDTPCVSRSMYITENLLLTFASLYILYVDDVRENIIRLWLKVLLELVLIHYYFAYVIVFINQICNIHCVYIIIESFNYTCIIKYYQHKLCWLLENH